MKHFYLLAALAMTAMGANAETKAYFFGEMESEDRVMGEVNGVSDNGKYAAITDGDNNIAYMWSAENPSELVNVTVKTEDTSLPSSRIITGQNLYDFTDDGMGVGSVFYKDGHQRAAIYKNGEWIELELHEFVKNTAVATCVTPDGKTIAGYQFINDPTAETGGRYYPCQWNINPDGGYDLNAYTEIELPRHQGFITMTQNVEGTIMGGMLFCGAGSTIPALIDKGELRIFNELEDRWEPWYYKGEIKGYDWEYYIDGYHDGWTGDFFQGFFDNCDSKGNFYGSRTRAFNVTEEGAGTLKVGACIYNVETDEWIDSEKDLMYTAGFGTDILFNGAAGVIIDGEASRLTNAFDFTASHTISGVSKISGDGQVLGGMWQEFNPAIGEYTYYPLIITLDQPLFDPSSVEVVKIADRLPVLLSAGRIDMVNGAEAEVYTLDGRLAGRGSSIEVPAGIYVVKSGDNSVKVNVR